MYLGESSSYIQESLFEEKTFGISKTHLNEFNVIDILNQIHTLNALNIETIEKVREQMDSYLNLIYKIEKMYKLFEDGSIINRLKMFSLSNLQIKILSNENKKYMYIKIS